MAAEVTTWVAPDGTQTVLDVDWAATGRFMAAVAHQELGVPGQPGSVHFQTLHQPHEFTLPVWMSSATDTGLRTAIRALISAMNPTRGMGAIRVQSPLGDIRQINCLYSDGLGLDESAGSASITSQKAAVLFRAFDPFWYDVGPTSDNWTITQIPTFFPIFPLRLTSSQIVVSQNIANNGDVPSWPVWTITGPGSVIRLVNQTTGESLIFNTLSLGAGQTLTIDTRPGAKTVLVDGVNYFSDLSVASSLWALTAGLNAFQLQMSGALAGQSTLSVSFWQGYLAP